MAAVKTAFGSYTLGFLLLWFTSVLCLAVLALMMMRPPASTADAVAPTRSSAKTS